MSTPDHEALLRATEEQMRSIGAVVLQFANIESMMGLAIAFHYVGRHGSFEAFTADVLGDDGFSYALRCNVLRKVFIRNGVSKRDAERRVGVLRELGGTRNLIAHAGKLGLSADGKRIGFIHPKEVGRIIDGAQFAATIKIFEEQSAEAIAILTAWVTSRSPFQYPPTTGETGSGGET